MKRLLLLFVVILIARDANSQETPLVNAPPPPSSSEQVSIIEAARNEALRYTANLPNFICTKIVRRQEQPGNSKPWKALDTLVLEVTFSQGNDVSKLISINGKSTSKKLNEVGGFTSDGDFGRTLHMIFDPKSEAKFVWERWTELRGRSTHVFSYSIDKAHSDYHLTFKTGSKKGDEVFAWHGLVYVDRDTQRLMRLTHVVEEIPNDWPISTTSGDLDYDFMEIEGKRILLPVRATAEMSWQVGTQHRRNLMEFNNYHQFSTETTIRFEK